MTYAEIGEYEEALSWVERCLAASNLEESHVRKAFAYKVNCLFQIDQYDDALMVCKRARQHFPDDVELLFREAMILHTIGQYSASIERYRDILRLPPTRVFKSADPGISGFKCRFNLGLVYGEANQPEMSELQFRQVLSDVPSYRPAIKALGNMLIENGRLTTAEIEAEKLKDNPDCCVDGLLLLARVQESRGDMAAAARTLKDSQQQFPNNLFVLEECCRFHFMNENWPESKQFLTSLIELDNNNAAAWHNLGAVLLRLNESEAAIDALTKSVELRPDSMTTRQLLETAIQDKVSSHNVE